MGSVDGLTRVTCDSIPQEHKQRPTSTHTLLVLPTQYGKTASLARGPHKVSYILEIPAGLEG